MRPKPWANGSADGTGLQVDSSARRSAGGEGQSSRASADSTQAATPQAFGDDMDVPWYCARPASMWRGIGARAPPGAQSVGNQPSGVGPRLENV